MQINRMRVRGCKLMLSLVALNAAIPKPWGGASPDALQSLMTHDIHAFRPVRQRSLRY
jgi:hypothetical protein